MLEFDELHIGNTASRLTYLSTKFEETALELRRTFDLHDAVPTAQQSNWMEFLLSYSKTLRFFAEDARRISEM
ncbi:hypothetical protein NCHU2750_17930 [Neorhizobium sp. NCHU2750]|nr:hypothetical protein NCHU2750_17930 [Neorhizobium sp. NCHU2750]